MRRFVDDIPVWHCSITLLAPNGAPLALGLWNDDVFVESVRLIRSEVLAGVGDPSREHVQIGDTALHFRRCCSSLELAELNAPASGLGLKIAPAGIDRTG